MVDYYKYPCIALTGGGDGSLDAIDGSLLKDGDAAYVDIPATKKHYTYTLDADSGASEISPEVISPDSNAGTKRWILLEVESTDIDFIQSGTGAVSRTVQDKLRDYISIKDFGATGNGTTDDTTYIQAALDYVEANGMYGLLVPAGTYRLTSGLVYSDTGYGKGLSLKGAGPFVSVLKMDASTKTILTVNHSTGGSGGYNYTTHGYVGNIGLQQVAGKTSVKGLKISNCCYYTFENIDSSNLSHNGFQTYATEAGDADIVALCLFKGLRGNTNTEYGFAIEAASGAIGLAQCIFDHCDFSGNTKSGMLLTNFDGVELNQCIVTANGGAGYTGGIDCSANGIYNKSLTMRGCEMGNGNYRFNLLLGDIINVNLYENRWVTNNGEAGSYGIEFGAVSTIKNFYDHHSRWIVGSSITPYVAYMAEGPTLTNCKIIDPNWITFDTSNKTKYSFTTPQNVVIHSDETIYGDIVASKTQNVTTIYAPDCFESKNHRITITGTGAFSVATPTHPVAGRELILQIYNASGGSITVSFDAVFVKGTYTDPGNGARATARFIYDSSSAKWIQIGAWAVVS